MNKPLIRQMINVITVLGIIFTVVFCFLGFYLGWFKDIDSFSRLIIKTGGLGVLVFILIQIIQVVIPIIPGGITTVAGVILFGPLWGFVYNYLGIVLGSVINFLLARHYGKDFVQGIVSPKTYNKYIGWLDKGKKFDKFFALAIFFPCAPDDFLCQISGLTNMSFKKFLTIIVLGKPASIFLYSMTLAGAFSWLPKVI
ncbi:TVP38/TMEM64 family protein [Anaerosacchariphilus polymeriproducens]|uniref:TVP38/TMEM64 family membrane protein n=1 Tax=Anaerosacchariphilus polymeriproducens TaxID=1812858 RepID=A0A371AU94_9FIRM|nr:VTT domain-containing protein [Anaerosacchariphilus polymeriproducens]RDU23136.1 TVP38/TMEM64 family protein [Anaerosacchariphilus polymeriproducens]